MADILQAMGIAGAILMGVAGVVVLVSVIAVKRGEIAMHGIHDTRAWWNTGPASEVSAGGALAGKSATADAGVLEILIFGTVLFGLAVLFLFGISILGQL